MMDSTRVRKALMYLKVRGVDGYRGVKMSWTCFASMRLGFVFRAGESIFTNTCNFDRGARLGEDPPNHSATTAWRLFAPAINGV